jgi:DNA-nicking Smr family endonuclease
MEGRNRKRVLSQEERQLWTHVTHSAKPLRRARATGAAKAGVPAGEQRGSEPSRDFAKPTSSPSQPHKNHRGRAQDKPLPAPAPFDPKLSKKIARGRLGIDARLDLHGLRQHDAHAALRRFLAGAQERGHQRVLVITGKGGDSLGRSADRDIWNSGERGVLRRLVPHWLSEAPLSQHVVSFGPSSLRHGGEGALYVTIRRGPRRRTER